MHGDNPYLVERLQGLGTTIFTEMTALAAETGAINLGQGMPDTNGPDEIMAVVADAMAAGHNQYPPLPGMSVLRQAIAEHQQRFYGLDYDPDTEIQVTMGASEALTAAVLALCERGDEVVMFEPYFDIYAAHCALAGATRRVVTLRQPDYAFDPDELAAAIGPRTRLLILNTPHNPTGKVFDRDELTTIAELCIEHDVLVISDEVYEHMVFDDRVHIPIATLPGMHERTITISSAGKTFSFTGWKVGWACAPAALVEAVRTVKQNLTFAGGTPFQPAVAHGLRMGDAYFHDLAHDLQDKRDHLSSALAEVGFEVFVPEGTYFVTIDVSSIGETDGLDFCRSLPERCGVVAVPSVVFYDNADVGRSLVRFTFCKQKDVLDEAVARLRSLAGTS
ncbi:MAG: pyridoxal phosphate-dependent aminotransferase [Acidimicrobiia bacterium]|nr:pyridoxal phosphate-dependent aminotransferase [Acidimicrobiia bacterium]